MDQRFLRSGILHFTSLLGYSYIFSLRRQARSQPLKQVAGLLPLSILSSSVRASLLHTALLLLLSCLGITTSNYIPYLLG